MSVTDWDGCPMCHVLEWPPVVADDLLCRDCADWLAGIGVDLAEMEAVDPHLAELGRNVEAAGAMKDMIITITPAVRVRLAYRYASVEEHRQVLFDDAYRARFYEASEFVAALIGLSRQVSGSGGDRS